MRFSSLCTPVLQQTGDGEGESPETSQWHLQPPRVFLAGEASLDMIYQFHFKVRTLSMCPSEVKLIRASSFDQNPLMKEIEIAFSVYQNIKNECDGW